MLPHSAQSPGLHLFHWRISHLCLGITDYNLLYFLIPESQLLPFCDRLKFLPIFCKTIMSVANTTKVDYSQ